MIIKSYKENGDNREYSISDIPENYHRGDMPEILDILLLDRTKTTKIKTKNIIWANDNYIKFSSKLYSAQREILPKLVTGFMGDIIKPRALKDSGIKKKRTKVNAEVFTPTWVVKNQIDDLIKSFASDNLVEFVNRSWIEITAGEAPYMVTRYDMETGELIPINERVGFLDRKLSRINSSVFEKTEWHDLAIQAYKSSYGFEWNGDSLLLARENLFFSYRDYYFDKWNENPNYEWQREIAVIISYNMFQMNGIDYTIPLSDTKERIVNNQLFFFEDDLEEKFIYKPGKRVKIMNWQKNKMEFFDKGVNK
ncbi:hypothetical protein PT033_06545 [Erysipelothrix rhusiopathiae]|uniref:hypothetical protein n=1 Tax=Erysipelothrix rhusiopathiae TaxID=1648 RepID=UPI0023B0F941|nr:hypothetical protein [Erysipelothrix rhusiopathiae]MDE8042381.1 hypothetical protein [Erysipelothrix rhusiopathiae]MDE8049686.1 hypothetical protein [Erysipelothrix rhusiopathiae]MDE8057583.1 hypothetical protein [Erysipelothrix rhusiopathiae]MDE8066354.1 hypothetical protein [Erysipelothrix rhusiopathiae]